MGELLDREILNWDTRFKGKLSLKYSEIWLIGGFLRKISQGTSCITKSNLSFGKARYKDIIGINLKVTVY
jgi:hypothetical protein